MNIRTIATFAVAIVLGLVAVLILNNYMGAARKTDQAAGAGAGGTPVVVAAAPIARGATLQPQLLKVVTYPQGSIPAGAFGAVGQLVGAQGAERVALRDMTPDEPILPAAVSGPGGRQTLSSVIGPGLQAVAIRSNDVAGVGGFVLPGDRVDVLLTRAVSHGDDQNSVTQIIAENVRVMGIDQSDNEQADKPAVGHAITIEVTPAQAQAVALGQTVGTVSLSLRHVADDQAQAKRATTVAEFGFTGGHAAPQRPATPIRAKRAGEGAFNAETVRVTRVTDTTSYRLGGH